MANHSELGIATLASVNLVYLTYFDFRAQLSFCVAARGQNFRKMFGDIPLRLGSRLATHFERAILAS